MSESELIQQAKTYSEETIEQLTKNEPLYAAILTIARRE